METLINKQHVQNELDKAGIKICLTRSVGCNSFNLIYHSFGEFYVNAIESTPIETIRSFMRTFANINILINQ